MKFIKIIIISIIFTISIFNLNVYAIEINGINIGIHDLGEKDYDLIVFDYDENNYYAVSHGNTSENYKVIDYKSGNGYYIYGEPSTAHHLINKTTKVWTNTEKLYFTSIQEMVDKMLISDRDYAYDGLKYINKNYESKIILGNNSKVKITNNGTIPMTQNYTLVLDKAANGDILIVDENGNMVENRRIVTGAGTNITINIPLGKTYTIYFQFDLLYIDTKIEINILDNSLQFSVNKQVPKYSILGQQNYEIDGYDNIADTPYIMPTQAKALVLVREEHDNIEGYYTTKGYIIEKNEKFYLPKNKLTVFRFMHSQNSTILVESNFNIKSSIEEIPLLTKDAQEVIDFMASAVYGTGLVEEKSSEDTILVATPGKSAKINRLGLDKTKLIGKMMDIYIEVSPGTTGKTEWFGKDYNWLPNEDDPIIKKMERTISDTMENKKKRLSIGQEEYIIITATTGTVTIRVPSIYKLNEDFTIDILNNYTTSEYEDDFIATNPVIPDLGTSNDPYSKDYNPNMYNWIQEQFPSSSNGELNVPNISNIGQQITSFTDMFLTPIKNLFTAMPEIYSLIIFAFGVSIVMFVLGR